MNFEIQIVTTISRYLKRFSSALRPPAVHNFDLFTLILFMNIIFSIERKCSRPISFGLAICICERSTHIATYSLRKNTTTSNCHTKVCQYYIISLLDNAPNYLPSWVRYPKEINFYTCACPVTFSLKDTNSSIHDYHDHFRRIFFMFFLHSSFLYSQAYPTRGSTSDLCRSSRNRAVTAKRFWHSGQVVL